MEPIRVTPCSEPSCRAPRFFLPTIKGANMPIDAATARCAGCHHPHAEGQGVINLTSRCTFKDDAGRTCECTGFCHQPIYNTAYHVSHFRTCKKPRAFSRGARRPR